MARRFQSVICRLGLPTGDGRIISPGALTSRDLPLPLSWQRESADGHGGSVVVGSIEALEFHPDMVTATGTMLDETWFNARGTEVTVAERAEVQQLVESGVVGPSLDLDDIEYVVDDQERVIITSGRISGATLVSIPAFAEVSITLDPEPVAPGAPALAASAAPELPQLEYFTKPGAVGPVVVDGDRVYGYVATWDTCHVGLPGCTTAPASNTGYAHFLRQEQRTSTGETVPVGVLSVGGRHAGPGVGVVPAIQHYDDVGHAAARVFAGEDEHGIWVAGWVPPYANPEKVAQLADSDVSGDWRRIGGNLELIAVCAVNTPGFPVLKRVSFSIEKGGQQTLIGQFRVETREPVNLGAEDLRARALWAKLKWEGVV